jgi:hypothetical protein
LSGLQVLVSAGIWCSITPSLFGGVMLWTPALRQRRVAGCFCAAAGRGADTLRAILPMLDPFRE